MRNDLDLFDLIFQVIDFRSFSNLWYWIGLAVVWSSASYFVLGIPFDMIQRARRRGDQSMADLEVIARIYVDRVLLIGSISGLWLVGFGTFMLSLLAVLGFVYRIEFAQAVFLIALPLSFVGVLSISTASRIATRGVRGEALIRALLRHRFWVQLIGVGAIFVTAMWGMYKNVYVGPFGH